MKFEEAIEYRITKPLLAFARWILDMDMRKFEHKLAKQFVKKVRLIE
jgi:hypothetical protein